MRYPALTDYCWSPPIPTFYRAVKNRSPSVADFLSYAALGAAPLRPLSPEQERQWRGVSVYSSLGRALWRAASLTPPYDFVARLELENGGPIEWRQTGRDPEHYSIWGDPEALLACVQGETVAAG